MRDPDRLIVWLTFAVSFAPIALAYAVTNRLRSAASRFGDARHPSRGLLAVGFALGGVGGAVFGILVGPRIVSAGLAQAALGAPLAEELGKGLLPLLMYASGGLRSRRAGLAVGLVVGAGFAGVENLLFAIQGYAIGGPEEWLNTLRLRLAFGTVIHMGASGILGAVLAIGANGTRLSRWGAPLAAVLAAVAIHGGWNAALVGATAEVHYALVALAIAGLTLAITVGLVVDACGAAGLRTREGAPTCASSSAGSPD